MTNALAPVQMKTRLDIWLWRANFCESRTIAARKIRLGHIRIQRAARESEGTMRILKPNTTLHIGDGLTFVFDDEVLHICVQSLGNNAGNTPSRRALYTHFPSSSAGQSAPSPSEMSA